MKVQFALVSVLLSLLTTVAAAAPSQAVYNKILSQGVPQDALNRMIHFLDENRGRSFQQSTYDCSKWPDSIRPCDESDRRPSTDVVTVESPQLVVIIDFTEASTTRRFYLIDL